MKYRRRIYYSAAQRAEILDRWQRGESMSAIARQLNERPRKTLQYQTPAEKFAECVAAIG